MQSSTMTAGWWRSPDGVADLHFASATHPGLVRPHNEDALLAAPPVFLVADGMGGHARGDVASRLVVEAFAPLRDQVALQPAHVDAAIEESRRNVSALADRFTSAPGSTLVAASYLLEDGRGYWLLANIGDSRAYSWREGVLDQLSTDHSVIQELIDAGTITRDEALGHPDRHVITRAIGGLADSAADFALIPAELGSRLLLCSDGLHSELSATAISHILSEPSTPDQAVATLVDAAVSAGGHDNVTVIVVDIRGRSDHPAEDTVPTGGLGG